MCICIQYPVTCLCTYMDSEWPLREPRRCLFTRQIYKLKIQLWGPQIVSNFVFNLFVSFFSFTLLRWKFHSVYKFFMIFLLQVLCRFISIESQSRVNLSTSKNCCTYCVGVGYYFLHSQFIKTGKSSISPAEISVLWRLIKGLNTSIFWQRSISACIFVLWECRIG